MTELPSGWASATVGSVLRIQYGKGLPERERHRYGSVAVYASSGQVGTHTVALTDGPTVIVGRKGAVGSVHLATGPSWPIDTAYFSAIPSDLSPHFMAYQLTHMRLQRLDSSTAIPSLRREDLEDQPMVIAPLAEQERIVAAIEEHLSRLDAGLAALQRVQQNHKRMRAAVLEVAMTGNLVLHYSPQDVDALLGRIAGERRQKWKQHSTKPYKEPAGASPLRLPVPNHWRVARACFQNMSKWVNLGHEDTRLD